MACLQWIMHTIIIYLQFMNDNVLKAIKLGFGFDRGFGVVGTMGKFNGFIGNDGASVDYIFMKEKIKTNESGPLYWYVGGG